MLIDFATNMLFPHVQNHQNLKKKYQMKIVAKVRLLDIYIYVILL